MEIYFAGGCFWGVQKLFSQLDGVVSTVCGYANGREDVVPSYERVCIGNSEYRELCMTLETLLKFFVINDLYILLWLNMRMGRSYCQ